MHNTKFKNRPVGCRPPAPRPQRSPNEREGGCTAPGGGRERVDTRRTSMPPTWAAAPTHTTRCSGTIVSSSVTRGRSGRAPARQRRAWPPGKVTSPSCQLLWAPLWGPPAPPWGQSSPRSWGQRDERGAISRGEPCPGDKHVLRPAWSTSRAWYRGARSVLCLGARPSTLILAPKSTAKRPQIAPGSPHGAEH